MTPAGLARTHAAAFDGKGWPATDFDRYLDDKTILIHGTDACFAVVRLAQPEAEILTLATHPDIQGNGAATSMLMAALATLKSADIQDVFLDVAADNAAARALYARAGFTRIGTRNNYYANGASAICLKAVLSPASPA